MIKDVKDLTSFKWATVRSVNPISVQLDGDPAPLALIPDCLVDPASLTVGNRVRVELSLRKVVIHGRNNGFAPYVPKPTQGLAADKPANPSYWQMYFETDTQKMMVGSKTGTWRQFAGTASMPARAWDTTQSNGVIIAGRTDNFTLPTVLENSEDVIVWSRSVGSGFGIVSLNGTARNPTNTVLSVRLMQLASLTTQAYGIGWQISPAAV